MLEEKEKQPVHDSLVEDLFLLVKQEQRKRGGGGCETFNKALAL